MENCHQVALLLMISSTIHHTIRTAPSMGAITLGRGGGGRRSHNQTAPLTAQCFLHLRTTLPTPTPHYPLPLTARLWCITHAHYSTTPHTPSLQHHTTHSVTTTPQHHTIHSHLQHHTTHSVTTTPPTLSLLHHPLSLTAPR